MRLTTLCYIEQKDQYLMLHRVSKQNDCNKDKWIGVGGSFESGESPEDCLIREVMEETGLKLLSYRFRGIVTFVSDLYETEYMCLYTADRFTGELINCDEGILEWVDKQTILTLNLWEGDKIFLFLLQENVPFFSLKLEYEGDRLVSGVLDGKTLELFDIRTIDGTLTGEVKERSMVHRDGDIHGTSHVWVVRKNEMNGFDVLLQKRSADKDAFPGCYDISSAGHIPTGCDFLESAVRELEEELGIIAKPDELHFIGMHEGLIETQFYGKPFRNYEISAVYVFNKEIDIEDLDLQKDEVESVLWMDAEECLTQMTNGVLQNCIFLDEFTMLLNKLKAL